MAKRAHITLSEGINVLPDELLVCILRYLSLKEAAATSILCRGWRSLWTFRDKLNFDGSDFFWRFGSSLKHFEHFGHDFLREIRLLLAKKDLKESWDYIAWVDNILGVHNGCSIEEFRVDFFVNESHKKYIDRWLGFASVKKVKGLELNLWCGLGAHHGYRFPCELFINFKHLRTMRLQWVNVSGEGIELLLGSSPLLEELSVSFSNQFSALKIIGPSLALKRLEIRCCLFTSIEIHDVNLEFFMYYGGLLPFVLKNVHLVEMHVGGLLCIDMNYFLTMFSSYLPQLEKLTVDIFAMRFFFQEAKKFYDNVKMSNLRQLKLMYPTHYKEDQWALSYLIRAAPLLQSFVFEAYDGSNREESWHFVKTLPKNYGAFEFPHLRQVEFIGYRGTLSELGLALHLLENGSALEQFIVDLRKRDNPYRLEYHQWPMRVNGGSAGVGYPYREEDKINAVKALVREQLTKRVPSTLQQHLHLNIL